MSHDADYLFALRLQSELDALDENEALPEWPAETSNKKRKNDDNDLNATQNIVNPEWETVDPTPDIYSLFGAFDIKFFQGKLKCVELEWSKRMYQCAGICYQRRNRMGMSVIIRLSEPLLKLRSRRDLIETMLHEMIHAYLFIQNIREGNGGHGPNFKRIMENINRVAGTNITVYHTFHDEVALYKTHIWRCNGICQHRKPFYGWVKRTCNRAPGPNDNWWAKHHETCSGTFVKVSEPETKNKAKKAKIETDNLPKITNWLNKSDSSNGSKPRASGTAAGGYTKMNGGGTVVLKPTNKKPTATITSSDDANRSVTPNATAGGNLNNVFGFRDLHSNETGSVKQPSFASGGHVLGSSESTNTNSTVSSPTENVRNIWANKFIDKKPEESSTSTDTDEPKYKATVTEASSAWEEIDDDILIHSVQNTVIEINDDSQSEDAFKTETPNEHSVKEFKPNISIKRELLDDLGENDSNIEMIDDEFDDTLNESTDILTDNSVIDEIFGTDTLMADFNNINNVVMNDPENVGNRDMEIVTCPICEDRMPRGELSSHLDGCSGITVKVQPGKRSKNANPLPFYKNQTKPRNSRVTTNEAELLRQAGYSQQTIDRLAVETREAREYNDRIMNELAVENAERRTTSVIQPVPTNNDGDIETVIIDTDSNSSVPEKSPCPVCNALVALSDINQHLDECLLNVP